MRNICDEWIVLRQNSSAPAIANWLFSLNRLDVGLFHQALTGGRFPLVALSTFDLIPEDPKNPEQVKAAFECSLSLRFKWLINSGPYVLYHSTVAAAVRGDNSLRRIHSQGRTLAAIVGPDWPDVTEARRTQNVKSLTRHVMALRDSSALPVLADALQDADLSEEHPVLRRLRGDLPYVVGEWFVRQIFPTAEYPFVRPPIQTSRA